jgi:ABC-2 type transport system permease protein
VTTLETQPTSKERASTQPRAGQPWPFRLHVIGAVFKRNLLSYFSNPAGYVFITLFVLISSCVAFWPNVFFTSNLANLDQLNRYMPYLLLFFIPAITMSSWADERRQGTDELLLTLPAHDLDVVLGKYFAALGIYTVALAFSLSHVFILMSLGGADYGILFANYVGYWLIGAMLIALGMVASLLSSNVTVAFILGALFCAVPIFLDWVGSPTLEFFLKNSGLRYVGSKLAGTAETSTGNTVGRLVETWSVPARFQDFGSGVITVSGFFYFLGIAAAMLYLNMVLLGRRHWAGGEASGTRWLHSVVRVAAVLLGLFSLTILIDLAGWRVDASGARLSTLSTESLDLIKQIPADRPVMIQAYYSPEVPREFVETKANLLRLLREYAAKSGGRIQLDLVPTELYSEEARDAEKRFGIEPRKVLSNDQARQMAVDVIMGVAFTSGLEEVVIPFFDRGLPTEYELTRSVRVVARSGRKKLGILTTDAKMTGGFDMRSFSQNPEWSIVTELKKQYDVSTVAPDASIPGDINVLLVAQPSSLTQKQIDNLTDYIKKGGATLLLLDPAPVENPSISPEMPRMPPGGPFGGGPPPEPKGNLRPLLDLCGIEWPSAQIVWNDYNPHPQLASLPREIVFAGASNDRNAFNPDQSATSGLQELVMLFPGLLRARTSGSGPEFIPLVRSGDRGGTLLWSDIYQQSFMGASMTQRRRYIPSGEGYTLAARITGQAPADAEPAEASKKDAEKKDQKSRANLNVIAIADLDFIGEQFFQIRAAKAEGLDFDNIPFVLNCVDVLAGDESFVSLRNKRAKHHTLKTLEAQTNKFYEALENETRVAEDQARKELDDAQRAFDKQVEVVQNNPDLDERAKETQLANLQSVAQRRLDVKKAMIEDQKQARIRDSRARLEQSTREIQNTVRFEAAALPPLPPLILGLAVWFVRRTRENLGANPKRLA